MAQKLRKQLKELGSKLKSPPASTDSLVKLLKQGATCLSEIEQSPPKSTLDLIQPFVKAITKPELLKHLDQEVKLFIAACICEITRITAPEAPYDDNLKDIFQLIVTTFSGLSDLNSSSFERRVVILETFARYKSCVVILDLEYDDIINEMFKTFFSVIRDEHPDNVLTSMQSIMELTLEEREDVQESLVLTLLSVLGCEKEDMPMAARRLSMNVIEHCAGKLEHGIKQYLVSSMSGDSSSLKSKINYHGVLYNIYRCAPQILSGVVPFLTGELLSDQLDIRLKAVGLVGDLFALPGPSINEEFQPVFLEFLKRLSDRVTEVRMAVLEHVKICLLANPCRTEAPQLISALCDRLLDYDENVRKQVVSVVCDVACHTLTSITVETIKLISDRLRDKSLMVKRYTMGRLADIYRVSCLNQSSGSTQNDGYDWIIGKILRCFYDKDFRSEKIEPILSLSLFPTDFSVKEKVKNWARAFSVFDKIEVKALEKILEQKQRLQQEMQKYLSLRQLSEECDGTNTRQKVKFCFRAMSCCFAEPAKAEENFQCLDQLKDSNIWKLLAQLLDPNTSSLQASNSRDDLLKMLDHTHELYEFLGILSLRCSYLLFNKDHVKEILLDAGAQKSSGSNELILSCMTILVILSGFCPLLLGGIEEDLVRLLEDDNEIIKEGTLHILAKAGGTIREQLGVSSRSVDLILERICIEGNRRQAKYAVHALASITKDDGLMSLSVLYKTLVDMLEEKAHLPAVLQSLGCIAQAAMPVFETRESEIEKFIKERILEHGQRTGDKAPDYWDDRSELCSLKIFGVKALVKSYLPVKDAHLRSGIDGLIEILKNILSFGDISTEIESSLVDRAHLKLAAAKSVLRLSKHWEHKIPIDVFYLTLRTSEENFPEVKKMLLSKIHQYVKDRILDPKYACAFLLDVPAEQSDLEENKSNLNDVIHMCWQGRGRQISSQSDANSPPLYPEYMLPYVIHSLAHHPSFPDIVESKDVKTFEAMYRQLYLFLSMLVHGDADGKSDLSVSKDKETLSLLNSIFVCIKHSEDAFDGSKSKNSYALCDLGMSILKRLSPKHDDLQHSSASVTLPSVLYKPLMKEENDSLVGEEKTWLADDGILAYFESLELEANGIVCSVLEEDYIIKDSETEGSEIPLGKLMKQLKVKGAKARKEVKNESSAPEVANKDDFDILKVVKEINSDNLGSADKLGSSNSHEYVSRKKRSSHKPQKRKALFIESKDVPMPKRTRMPSAQAQKSLPASPSKGSKGSKRPTNINKENIDVDLDKMDDDIQTSSEYQSVKGKKAESAVSDLLVSCVGKKLNSSSRQKGKRSDRDHAEALSRSPYAKKSKKVAGTDNAHSISYPESKSIVRQKQKSVTGLAKCTNEDNESLPTDLVGRRIKVWWPLDKQFYEGVVKSFDPEKKKHVILYDDGDVEVLRLTKEHWELIDNVKKSKKRSGLSKGFGPKGESSGQQRKSIGDSKQDEKLQEKSPLSLVRGKRTPRKGTKQRPKSLLKSTYSTGSGGSLDGARPVSTTRPLVDDSDSEKEDNEKIDENVCDEEPSNKDKKIEQDAKKGLAQIEKPKKEEDIDSKNTQSDDVGGSLDDAHGSDNEAVSSSHEKPQEVTEEKESGQESEETGNIDTQPTASDKTDKKTSASDPVDAEPSDDELLSTWKLRAGKK